MSSVHRHKHNTMNMHTEAHMVMNTSKENTCGCYLWSWICRTTYEPLTHSCETIIIPGLHRLTDWWDIYELFSFRASTLQWTHTLIHSLPCPEMSEQASQHVMEIVRLYVSCCCDWCWGSPGQCVIVALCVGEGCSRSHPAADVAGEGGATGEGDWADCCRICQ